MKRTLIFILKLLIMGVVFTFVGVKFAQTWHTVSLERLHIDWPIAALIPLGMLALSAVNALTWLWLARSMGDRHAVVPLLGAYTFSQAGKYVPGKVLLVLLRLERTYRVGMEREVCLLSTALENGMYALSGALVGVAALLVVARNHPLYIVLCALLILLLLGIFHPRVFFTLLNLALKSMKRGPIPPGRHFRRRHMAIAVVLFCGSWLGGGLALWAAVRCVHALAPQDWFMLCGVFALSVSLGMFSLLPGGLGVRDAVQALMLMPVVHSPELIIVAVAMLRLFQIAVELLLALVGGVVNIRWAGSASGSTFGDRAEVAGNDS